MTQQSDTDHDHETAPEPVEERVATRAGGLTPEEQEAGSDDPEAQARAILAESEDRIAEQAAEPDDVERRTSDEATEPT
ncbi:MAG: hypothetical protein R2761_08345 [Acidimicrobiales bacterium]